jgi:uncharacterized protein YfiM (DUF2279 family)
MNILGILNPALLLPVLFFSGCASFHHPGDAWWGEDKAKHVVASGLIGAGATALALNNDSGDGESVIIGVAVSAAVGAGKETYDRNIKGTYWSGKDLAWDILGSLLGSLIVVGTD